MNRIIALGLSLALASPAAAVDTGHDTGSFVRAEDHRIAQAAYRIALAGAASCPEPSPLTGLFLHHLAEYAPDDRPAAILAHGLDEGPAILSVIEASAAAKAGLAASDVVIAVNGKRFASPGAMAGERDEDLRRKSIEASERWLETQLRRGAATLTVRRAGRDRDILLSPPSACPARARLARSTQLNAFANRGYAIVTTAMLDFIESDDELAIVLAHEMAHVILRHPEQLDAAGVPDGFLRGFGSNAARVRETEVAADRLGIELAWRAGYDVRAAIPFWRRFSARRGPRLNFTHPGLRNRERIVAETIAALHTL